MGQDGFDNETLLMEALNMPYPNVWVTIKIG